MTNFAICSMVIVTTVYTKSLTKKIIQKSFFSEQMNKRWRKIEPEYERVR